MFKWQKHAKLTNLLAYHFLDSFGSSTVIVVLSLNQKQTYYEVAYNVVYTYCLMLPVKHLGKCNMCHVVGTNFQVKPKYGTVKNVKTVL